MPRHALDPTVAFGTDAEQTIPWSSVSASVAVLDLGPEDLDNADPTAVPGYGQPAAGQQSSGPIRGGRHRKAGKPGKPGRGLLGDPRFHAGATLGLMGTIFLPQLSHSAPGTAASTVSVEPEASTETGTATEPTAADHQRQQDSQPKHALGEPRQETPQAARQADGPISRAEAERQLEAWTRQNAKIGVPARALRAYLNAEHRMSTQHPSCRLRWNLLAGVGRIESNHGRFDGRTLGNNGMSSQKIIGIPLDGSAGVRAIYDTDGGAMDGDTTYDRAVGPMQFIPSTWDKWAEDGNRDGKADPHSIDDAAFTAANYLCGHGSRLDTEAGQRAALYGYNNSYSYGEDVISHAAQYIAGVAPLPDDINPRAKHAARDA